MPLSLAATALFAPVEKAVNTLLAQDPHAAKSLAGFHGKRIAAQTPRIGFILGFELASEPVAGPASGQARVRLAALHPGAVSEPVDVTIAGPASSLLKMLGNGEHGRADRNIRIEGDAELLLDLQQTLNRLDIRWEDLLQPALGDGLGDVLIAGIGDAAAGARDWSRQAGGNIKRNLANYLQYESGAMPTPEDLATFADQVDNLRLRLDRLQARLDILTRSQ